MMPAGRPARYVLAAALVWLVVAPPGLLGRPADLPARLSDAEFWHLVEDLSESNGFFRSDNLVSNEDTFQDVIPELQRTVRPGGVYIGVGPDQNFTYLVALKPRLAFITDIRRGNLQLQLMYKALAELSADRAEFLSYLFGRKRPVGLGAASTAGELFAAYSMEAPSRELQDASRRAVIGVLRNRHKFPIDEHDEAGIVGVMNAFFTGGPGLAYASGGPSRMRYPTYEDLQMATDGQGQNRAYLGTEERFRTWKAMEQNNLVVPVVGNFAGPKALRSIGKYLRAHGSTVTAFYVSNVEQYLFQDRIWPDFARNLASLPMDGTSTIIRACFTRCQFSTGSRSVTLLDSMTLLVRDFEAGRIATYWDVLSRGRPAARRAAVR
jgi:hypothetical protein